MRRFVSSLALLLLSTFSVFADDQAVARARAALNAEPEARKIQQMSSDLQNPKYDPAHPGQRSAVGTAVDATADMRQMNRLMDQLEDRLNREVRECHFCSDKQEELSELIRERMYMVSSSAQALGHDRAPLALKFMGITPTAPTRWSDVQIALREPAEAWRSHCGRPPMDKYCTGANRVEHLADEHEKSWADCFNKSNWVETGSKRRAYEACMSATDPIVQMWELDHKSGTGSSPYTDVGYMDVNELHFYGSHSNRFNTDPEKLPADAQLIIGQTAQMTLLEPIVAPPGPYPGNTFQIAVRARLENPLDAEAAPGTSIALTNAMTLDPSLAANMKGRVEAIAAGTEFPIRVWVSTGPGAAPTSGNLDLMVGPMTGTEGGEASGRPTYSTPGGRATASRGQPSPAPQTGAQPATAVKDRGNTLITQRIIRKIPWPQPGAVIMPAGAKLSFATACGCRIPFTLAEFKRHLTDRAANPVTTTFATRVLAAHSGIQPALLEPVTISGIRAGKRFHAQLERDMMLPQGTGNRADLITLRKGADVYFKVIDKSGADPSQPGSHSAALVVDYLVLNGKQVSIKAGELPFQYVISTPGARRPAMMSDVVIPAGMNRAWYLDEDVNVEAADLGAADLKQDVPPPPRGASEADARRNIADFNESWFGHGIVLSGVVSRVEQVTKWDYLLHFQGVRDDKFVVCIKTGRVNQNTWDSQTGGNGFEAFVGKTLEFRSMVMHPQCSMQKFGIDVLDANLLTVAGSSAQSTTVPAPAASRVKR